MHFLQILYEFSSKKCSTVVTKLLKLYYENRIFLLLGDFHIRLLRDAYQVPTWIDFGIKNPPKSALGRLLGRLLAVLSRLGQSWRPLKTSWRGIKKWCQKSIHKKSRKNASSGVFGRFGGGGSSRARGRAVPGWWRGGSVRSPKLDFRKKKKRKKTKDEDERRKTKDDNSHSRRRAERGGGYWKKCMFMIDILFMLDYCFDELEW